jgi:hypothetical protein
LSQIHPESLASLQRNVFLCPRAPKEIAQFDRLFLTGPQGNIHVTLFDLPSGALPLIPCPYGLNLVETILLTMHSKVSRIDGDETRIGEHHCIVDCFMDPFC